MTKFQMFVYVPIVKFKMLFLFVLFHFVIYQVRFGAMQVKFCMENHYVLCMLRMNRKKHVIMKTKVKEHKGK